MSGEGGGSDGSGDLTRPCVSFLDRENSAVAGVSPQTQLDQHRGETEESRNTQSSLHVFCITSVFCSCMWAFGAPVCI